MASTILPMATETPLLSRLLSFGGGIVADAGTSRGAATAVSKQSIEMNPNVVAAQAEALDLGEAGNTSGTVFENIVKTLYKKLTKREADEAEVTLVAAQLKLKFLVTKQMAAKLLNDQEKIRASLLNKQDKLEVAQEKTQEAQEKAQRGKIWQKISAALAVIASAVAIVVGSCLIATGNPIGGLLIAAGLLGIVTGANSCAMAKNGDGFLSSKCQLALSVVLMALAVVTMGGFALGVGVRASASVASATTSTGATAAESSVAAATFGGTTARLADSGVQIATAATGIGVAVIEKQAGYASADARIARAEVNEAEADFNQIADIVAELIDLFTAETTRFGEINDELMTSLKDRGEMTARIKFRA
ncbi:hypothetical protein PDO_5035 [Rhizobium sp. PDO1-076]|nr:hypothetical protein PDO_5035 [Rhizobium sp. PDO1-076]